ncbi:hypothetical protein THTE_4499 [Thermogutta terrifontis]|uniref:Uncharacterized protein n=1 Tax=Thermogutta terrifontis TaxID=1331910 RepID=A0A286RMB0_9BACT|nr:hypothetical protein THTE_4499 [Thermogutta terrifontis]
MAGKNIVTKSRMRSDRTLFARGAELVNWGGVRWWRPLRPD